MTKKEIKDLLKGIMTIMFNLKEDQGLEITINLDDLTTNQSQERVI